MRLCVFEDAGVLNLEPLSLTRPAFDLRLGAGTLLTRLRSKFPVTEVGVLVRPSLVHLCRLQHPDVAVNDIDWLRRGPVLFVNARWFPATPSVAAPVMGQTAWVGEQLAYAALDSLDLDEATPKQLAHHLTKRLPDDHSVQAGGLMLDYLWHLVDSNSEALAQDYLTWQETNRKTVAVDSYSVVGPRDLVLIDSEANIEPHVLFDTTRGPILIERGATVQAFSRLEGPCYVGQGTQILAARLRGGSIGPECRIGGEVEASIVQGYSNKYHDGFLGHSYVGEWVNFGAGSHTSDLRTDYGSITMRINGSQVPSGRMKIGSYLGDHTRMSINTLLNTGSVVGPFGLLLTSGMLLPRVIPSFCRYGYGRVQERTDLGQMFATAGTVMARRGQQWTETHSEYYFDLYEQTATNRERTLRENEQQRLRHVV